MSIERAKKLLKQNEGISLEFKESKSALPSSLFETICAMLNRNGGDIFLGVKNNGEIIGVLEDIVQVMLTNITNLSNNTQKLDPPFILFPQLYVINKQTVVHIQVPSSSQIHKSAGNIFDRSNDGDFKVTSPQQIAELFNYKRNFYTESQIYPGLKFEDFKIDLFQMVKQLIRNQHPNHPWLALDNKKMLEMAGLWRRDLNGNQAGYTLAAALLFGKDTVIQSILPHYKIDAIVRIHNTERYDDRLYIQTNLIEAYDLLIDFVNKHLPDTFFLERNQRVSLRNIIFREIVSNLIIHREYTNALPCTFIIERNKVIAKNANNPHGDGPIDANNFAPFPKNPTLAKFFIQIGRVDELGSGLLNVTRYIKHYAGKEKPLFIEGSSFSTEIPIPSNENGGLSGGLSGGSNGGLSGGLKTLLDLIEKNPGLQQKNICKELNNMPLRTLEKQIKYLSQNGYIIRKGSSKSGGYWGLNGGSNGGLSGGLNGRLKTLLNLIEKNPGLQQKDLSQKLNNRPLRTLEKQINFLVQNGNIIRKGSPKSGGYFKVEN